MKNLNKKEQYQSIEKEREITFKEEKEFFNRVNEILGY